MNRLSALVVGVVAVLILPTFGLAAPDRTRPKLAYDPTINRVLVVYESLTDIYRELRNPDGTPLSPEFVVSNGNGNQQDVSGPDGKKFMNNECSHYCVWGDKMTISSEAQLPERGV